MPLHDTTYQHWDGVHLGLWRRRLVIAENGLKAGLQVKGMRQLVMLCWIAGLGMSVLLFAVGQLLVADSIVAQWVGNLNPQLQVFARVLTTWLEQHPQISVRTTQNLLFYFFCAYLLRASIFALGMVIPLLITRDLASNAIIIYSSKAVSRGDYLLGKFAAACGLVGLTSLGPACAAWFLGNLLAPDWRFFWHSRVAIANTLVFGVAGTCILSLLALGVSAFSSKERVTVALWYAWWIAGGVLAPIAVQTRPWLQRLSFNFDLRQIALAVFRPGAEVTTAQENIPILGDMLRGIRSDTLKALNAPDIWGALLFLAIMGGVAALVIRRRVKPE